MATKAKVVPAAGEEPLPVEIIEQAIVKISEAMQAINKTRLTRKALVILIHYNTKVPQRDIELVLNNLDQLEATWLKRKSV